MCIAIAEQRGWTVATDDRKAIRVAQQAGLTVVSCPELVKRWADATGGQASWTQGARPALIGESFPRHVLDTPPVDNSAPVYCLSWPLG